MKKVRTIEIFEDVFADQTRTAAEIREKMTAQKTLFLNVMSAPGSGKTTFLTALINRLKDQFKIGEMDVDIETSLDAHRVSVETGIPSLQIHNGGLCHIDADMVSRALVSYDTKGLELLILENIGNLVCPAEFDTGAHKNIMLFSIPEGDDKPLKYPLMFQVCDLILISKIDALEYFDFDLCLAEERIRQLNPDAVILPVSARTGEGMDQVVHWIMDCRRFLES